MSDAPQKSLRAATVRTKFPAPVRKGEHMDLLANRGDHAHAAPTPTELASTPATPGTPAAALPSPAVFTASRQAPPRYEVRAPGCTAVPCGNATHAATALSDKIGERVTMQQVYRLCRGDAPKALTSAMPAGVAVAKLTDAERATRPPMHA